MTEHPTIDWSFELVDQIDLHWQVQLRPRLDGLTDAEYLWEPAQPCWNLRPRAEATTPMAAGLGDVVADFAFPAPAPEPLTTIAWRMGHVAVGCLGMRASNHFGDGSVSYETTDWSLTASGGLQQLDDAYDAWMSGVRALDEAALARPCGPAEGPYGDRSFATLVLHINREVIHHGAEIALLRDLYRARGGAEVA